MGLGGEKELLGLCGRQGLDNVLSRGAMDDAVDTPWYVPHNQRRPNGEVGRGHQDQVKELERHGRLYGCRRCLLGCCLGYVLGLHEARDSDQEVDVGDVEGLQMCKMYETAMDKEETYDNAIE